VVLTQVDLAGSVHQLLQLVVDLGAIQLLQRLATPQHRCQAIGIEAQHRLARVLVTLSSCCGAGRERERNSWWMAA